MTSLRADRWLRGSSGGRRAPRPVAVGRYRYSKLRWRIAVHLIDGAGSALMGLWRRVRPSPPPSRPRRILVVQLDHLGDAVLTSPMLERLRTAYPDAVIDVLASPSNCEVFAANPHVDHVRVAARNWFERQGRGPMLSAVWSIGRSLRGAGYDLGIDVRGDILSILVLTIAGIRRRVGWTMGGGGFLLTDVARWQPGRHEVESRLALLEPLELPIQADEPPRVQIQIRDHDRLEVARRLGDGWPERIGTPDVAVGHALHTEAEAPDHAQPDPGPVFGEWHHSGRFRSSGPLLAVHLGAGTAAKRWPASCWRSLIGRFLREGWRVVMVGGAEDSRIAETIPPHPELRDWTGLMSVTQTAALLERADLFIGSDSGPSHLAACTGTPSVVLFSGTNQSGQWRPWSRRSLILKEAVPCRPCHHKVCPLADHPCMAGLTPDRVHDAALRWWSRLQREETPHAHS